MVNLDYQSPEPEEPDEARTPLLVIACSCFIFAGLLLFIAVF